jgi:sugar diacid utilization regulator
MDIETKVYENRLRRWAKRLGLDLHKSRARLFNINDQGGYQLIDQQKMIIAGERMELTLEDIKGILGKIEQELSSKTR